MPFRIPRAFDQRNCILNWKDDGKNRFLDWDMDILAPVSKIMGPGEAAKYMKDLGYDKRNVITVEGNDVFDIIINNKAGLKGEWIIWEDILKLYK